MKTTPCQKPKFSSHSLIPEPDLNTWGHDQTPGNQKHLAELAP